MALSFPLVEPCQLLAEGTSLQKRRAWSELTYSGGLWCGCSEAVRDPAGLQELATSHGWLAGCWDRRALVDGGWGSAEVVESQVDGAIRLVAAAAVSATVAQDGDAPPERLLCWARRAAGLEEAALAEVWTCGSMDVWTYPALGRPHVHTSTLPHGHTSTLPHVHASTLPHIRLGDCFKALAALRPLQAGRLASVRDTALALLGDGVPVPTLSLRLPVLLARQEEGFLAWLLLEQLAGGFGAFFPAAGMELEPLAPDLRAALDTAWQAARRDPPPAVDGEPPLLTGVPSPATGPRGWGHHSPLTSSEDIRWRLTDLPRLGDGRPLAVGGTSLQAAAAVGLELLLAGRSYDPRCAISATLGPDGTLAGVEGIRDHGGPKLRAARSLRPRNGEALVVVSPEDRLSPAAQAEWEGQGVRVVVAATIAEARELASPAPSAAGLGEPAAERLGGVVVLHQPGSQPDERVAQQVATHLEARGYRVFVDRQPRVGIEWARVVEQEVQAAEAVVPLLSARSAQSELIVEQIEFACQAAARQHGRPRLLPVRIYDPGPLPAPLAARLGLLEALQWAGPGDDARLARELTQALQDPLRRDSEVSTEQLAPPTGVVPLESEFYIDRPSDLEFRLAVRRRDSIVRIKGARQMGKTSLLARGLQQAREAGLRVVFSDFQRFNSAQLESAESFCRALARWLAHDLELDASPDATWDPLLGPNWNFREFLLTRVLARLETPLVWAIDEADRLFPCEFGSEVFGLLRSFHNERALNPTLPWNRLTMALAYATEAHLYLADLNQSPFNVGTRIALYDFTPDQVAELNRRYGLPLRGEEEVARYHQLLGGQPYLTHRGLHLLVSQGLRLPALEQLADRDEGPFGDHLGRLVTLLARDASLTEATREVLRRRPCPNGEAFARLWSAGVLSGESNDGARPRCQLYARYLERHLL